MYATNMYCIFLQDQTGNAPVISVYMEPAVALERVAKTKHILHRTCFMDGEHVVNLSAGPHNVGVVVACGGSVGSMATHMAFVGGANGRESNWS